MSRRQIHQIFICQKKQLQVSTKIKNGACGVKGIPPKEGTCCGCGWCGCCPSDDTHVDFELSEISSGAWEHFKTRWGYYIGNLFMIIGVEIVAGIIQGVVTSTLAGVGFIVNIAIGLMMHWTMLLIACNSVHASFEFMRGRRERNVSCSDPFMNACCGGQWVWLVTKVWLLNLLLVVLGGFLIFPGIYFAFALSFSYSNVGSSLVHVFRSSIVDVGYSHFGSFVSRNWCISCLLCSYHYVCFYLSGFFWT
jgi:hypothetical protein